MKRETALWDHTLGLFNANVSISVQFEGNGL